MNSSCLVNGDGCTARGTWTTSTATSSAASFASTVPKSRTAQPKEVWRKEGIEDGFPTVTLGDDTLYSLADNAQLYAFDAKTGKEKFHKGMGTIGKASLVYGDGKLYIAEANGRFSIVKPGANKVQDPEPD